MRNYKISKEDDRHFEIDDGEGKFRVAKKGLSKGLHDKIRGFATGGEATEEPRTYADVQRELTEGTLAQQKKSGETLGSIRRAFLSPVGKSREEMNSPEYRNLLANKEIAESPAEQQVAPQAQTSQAPQAPTPAATGPSPAVTKGPPTAGIDRQLSAQEKQYEDALKSWETINGVKGLRLADNLAQSAQAKAEEDQKHQAEHAAWVSKRAESDEAIRKGAIDPNRYMASKGTAGRITSALSIMLAGIGQGLTGRPGSNVALDIIDREIDRDIAAQRNNLDTLKSRHRDLMQEGLTMDQAHRQLKIDMTADYLARAEQINMQFAPQEKQAQNAMLLADRRKQNMFEREKLVGEKTANSLHAQDLGIKQMQMNEHMAGMEAVRKGDINSPYFPAELRKRFVPGEGFKPTEKEAEERRTQQSAEKVLGETAATLPENKTAGEHVAELMPFATPTSVKTQAAATRYATSQLKALGYARPPPELLKRYTDMAHKAMTAFSSDARAAARTSMQEELAQLKLARSGRE